MAPDLSIKLYAARKRITIVLVNGSFAIPIMAK